MKSLNILLLASLIASPIMPMIKIGDNNTGAIFVGGTNGFWDIKVVRNLGGKLSIIDGQVKCDKCTAVVELTGGYFKKVVECVDGNCTETDYNTWTRKQIVPPFPLNNPEIAQNESFFGFLATHPILSRLVVGGAALATGYGLYKLSKWVQKSKKQ